uniref:Nucleosome assembly protein 1A n=1 Tax=Karenia brevis TaxID=156230 RepID=A0A6N0X399_KARBR|nr:nucleosome assembly protein 1A [Karenia brevis]
MGRKRRAQGAPDSENTVYEGQGDPLLVALFQEDAESARQLIESNLCNIEATDQVGWRPLHRACYAGLDSIVSILLERRADPTALDVDGCGPLHVAASKGFPDCCKLLVAAGADPTQPDRYTGMTPQIYAMSKEEEVARKLGEILGTLDQKLLVAWSNPAEMAKLNATAETEEELTGLKEKFIKDLDKPKDCCDSSGPARPRISKTYTWASNRIGKKDRGLKSVPKLMDFWEAAMQNLPELEDKLWIQVWDKPVLQYCSDFTVDGDDFNEGFKLTFHFLENPYFTNSTLEKQYYNFKSSPNTGESDAMEIKSTEIKWKPGKDVTVEKVEGDSRQKSEEEEQPRFSFFRNFFCNLKQGGPFPDQFDEDNVRKMTGMDDREQMMGMLMGIEYELGCSMRDQLVRFAIGRRAAKEAATVCEDDNDEEKEDDDGIKWMDSKEGDID